IKDQSITVDELVKQTGAKLSENVKVRRFVRFVVGEETEADKAAEAPAEAPAPAPVEAVAPKEEKKEKKDDKKKKK
ncbi:MAG: translation elongation factor Ts, partial [Pseudanabaena sp.]